ncbi:MAG TPA: DsbA family protein [Stellaceae bacterium]|jgi:protein-disulfide isomerase|nr:DsbA family protein [Stellaceae bacterium]
MREIWFAVLVLLTLAGPVPALAQAPAKPPPTASQANPLELTPGDRLLGNPDAPVTIVEYASLTCPHCAHFAVDVLPKLKAKWIDTGKAKLVLRDYPLDEPALRAAMIARCAPPDKFYAFIDTLFGAQQKWVLAKDYEAALARLALLGGMTKKDFDACLANKSVEDKVLQSRLVATEQLGVNATPTFFINGTKFDGAPEEDALDAAISHAAGS